MSEKLLGYKLDELLNRNITDMVTCENFTLMNQQLQKGREFHGNMNCKRKNNGTITISSKIIPFCAYGKYVKKKKNEIPINLIDNINYLIFFFLNLCLHFPGESLITSTFTTQPTC